MSIGSLSATTHENISGPPIRPQRSDLTWLYFVGVNREQIKIGHSRTPTKRLTQHAKGGLDGPVQIDQLCFVRGKESDEKAIQRYFAHLANDHSDEVFRPDPELIEYIRWLRDQWFVAMPNAIDEQLDAVDSSLWLPNPERRKPRAQGVLPGMLGLFDLGERVVTGDDFYTNKVIIDAARKVLGCIDLDPASHAEANRVVQAKRFYTISDNGLAYPWAGGVWLNPPFSQWEQWVPKVLAEWDSGRVREMCVLSAMRTVTAQYFAPLLQACHAVCVIRGRIKFWGGKAGDSPDDGHAIFYFGTRRQAFSEAFSELGTVFYRGEA